MSEGAAPPGRPRRGGLFTRIFLTFLATAIASAVVAGIAGFSFARRFSAEWIAEATTAINAASEQLVQAHDDEARLATIIDTMGQDLDARIGLFDRRGHKLAGEGPDRLPRGSLGNRRALRRGEPVVLPHHGMEPPGVVVAVLDPEDERVSALVAALPRPGLRLAIPLLALGLMLPVLGGGAWILSRSLTRRLARLESSADRIAAGELGHRIALDHEIPRDELDQLGRAFNEMAQKVEALLQGQRTLLANVSHELRTPIARMKVLIEILQERMETLRGSAAVATGASPRVVQRLDKGLHELGGDITEIETLISDLLTSGRLELRHGTGQAIQAADVDVDALLDRVAAKVGARVDAADDVALWADELLVERLLSNLLANARRACPDGELSITARRDGEVTEIAVQDEGPGVDPAHRETIFEPFTRLDDARDRDRGGVGLGLYLCRQICLSHQGSIEVTDRLDGARGARFVVRLPARRRAAA